MTFRIIVENGWLGIQQPLVIVIYNIILSKCSLLSVSSTSINLFIASLASRLNWRHLIHNSTSPNITKVIIVMIHMSCYNLSSVIDLKTFLRRPGGTKVLLFAFSRSLLISDLAISVAWAKGDTKLTTGLRFSICFASISLRRLCFSPMLTI